MKKISTLLILFLFAKDAIKAQIPSYIPKDSLVGWWPFNGNADDESGNGNHGIVYNAALGKDRIGNSNSAYDFKAPSSNIIILHKATQNFKNEFSISLWAMYDSSIDQSIFVRQGDGSKGNYDRIWLTNTRGAKPNHFRVYNENSHAVWFENASIYNKWYHIVAVLKDSLISLYNNNNFIGMAKVNNSLNCSPTVMVLGYASGMGEFNGEIDDVAIWNRALDSNEIKSIYNGSTANVKNDHLNSKIKIYPNPADDQLVIDFGNYYSMAGYEVNIFDVAGKSVYNSTINKSSETIDLNTWKGKGVYVLKIYDKLNQQIENRKIVIQ